MVDAVVRSGDGRGMAAVALAAFPILVVILIVIVVGYLNVNEQQNDNPPSLHFAMGAGSHIHGYGGQGIATMIATTIAETFARAAGTTLLLLQPRFTPLSACPAQTPGIACDLWRTLLPALAAGEGRVAMAPILGS